MMFQNDIVSKGRTRIEVGIGIGLEVDIEDYLDGRIKRCLFDPDPDPDPDFEIDFDRGTDSVVFGNI